MRKLTILVAPDHMHCCLTGKYFAEIFLFDSLSRLMNKHGPFLLIITFDIPWRQSTLENGKILQDISPCKFCSATGGIDAAVSEVKCYDPCFVETDEIPDWLLPWLLQYLPKQPVINSTPTSSCLLWKTSGCGLPFSLK